MSTTVNKLWHDDGGFVVSVELILIATIAVIGLMAGMTAIRDAVVSELSDVAGAVQDLNQGYTFYGVLGHSGSTAGSDFADNLDYCDTAGDAAAGSVDNCIAIGQAAIQEGAAPTAPTVPAVP